MGVISAVASQDAAHSSVGAKSFELIIDKGHRFDFFTLNGLTWIDWATVAGLILTVVGFGITWWQLHRTYTARQAVNHTRREINRSAAISSFSKSIPSFRTLYEKARSAAYEKDKEQLRQMLENWSRKCEPAILQLEQLQEERVARRGSRKDDDRVAMVVGNLRSAQNKVKEALRKMDDHPDMLDFEVGIQYALTAMREFSDLAMAIAEDNRYLRKVAS